MINRRDTDDRTPDNGFGRNDNFDDIIDEIDDQHHNEDIQHEKRPHQEDTDEEMSEDAFDRNDDNDDNDWNQNEYENDAVEDPEGEEDKFGNKNELVNNPKGQEN